MKNLNFDIRYRESVFFSILAIFLILFCAPLFAYTIYAGFDIVAHSVILSRMICTFILAIMIILLIYEIHVIKNNWRKYREISHHNGTFRFPASRLNDKIIEIPIKDINSASVNTAKKSGAKYLSFNYNYKTYGINANSFTEEEFSMICNTMVKRSDRCKACQSTWVEWKFERGHCYNCETMTPRNADDFDWDDAYKA